MSAARSEAKASTATGIARYFSRVIRAAGLTMADTRDRYRWTEGFHVHRVGCSGTVAIDYHIPHFSTLSDRDRIKRREKLADARLALFAVGYVLDERMWFEVQ